MRVCSKKGCIGAITISLTAFLLFSCTKAALEKPQMEVEAPLKVKLPVAEQNQKSLEVFEKILEMTAEGQRVDVLPEMEAAYLKIISDYPDAILARESYWRLILMNLEDHIPPRVEEAKGLYREFLQRYPDSDLKSAIEDTIARSFYKYGLWQDLLEFCMPQVKEYITTGRLNGPFFLFLFTESNLNLGDIVEAEKGYKIVIEMFPASAEAAVSKDRLEEIKIKKR